MHSDHPESIHPTEQIYLALNLFHEQAFAEAQALCDSILRAYPDQVQALQLRGLIALQAGQADVALPDLERCVEDYPTEDSFQINHGLALAALGKTAAAQAAFLQAVSLNPLSPEACYQLGQLALAEADQSLAQKWFLEALARYPNFQAALQGLSLTDLDEAERRVWEWRAQWAQGNDLEATCHQALQQNPEQESLRLLLGEILIQQEKWAEAEAVVFAEQASLSPALLWLQVQVSEACRHRLRWQQALSLLLVQEPDHWLAHQSRLRLLFCEERYTELPAAYEQAVRNSPQSLFRHCYAAALNAGKPDSEQAPLFRKLLVNQALLSAYPENLHALRTRHLIEKIKTGDPSLNTYALADYLVLDRKMPVFPASFPACPALALHPDFSPVEMVSAYQAYGPHFAFSPFFLSPFSWDSLQELVAQAYAWHGWESAFLRADISTGFWHPLLADLIGLLRQSFADILGDLPLMALELKREFLNPIEKPAPRFLNGQIAVQLECLLRPQEAEWVMFDQVAPDFASEAIYAKFCQDKTAQNAWMRTQVKRYYALPCQAGSLLLHEATQAHALRPLQAHVQQRCGLSLVFGQRSSVHAVHA